MISATQVSNAAPSGSVDVRTTSTIVARQAVTAQAQAVTAQAGSNQKGANRAENAPRPSTQEVQRAVARANAQLVGLNEGLSFGFVKELGELVVQVTDQNSGAVIRQFPSKEFIAQQIASKEFLGLLLNKQA